MVRLTGSTRYAKAVSVKRNSPQPGTKALAETIVSENTGTNKVSVSFSNAQMRERAFYNQVLGKTKREFFGFNDRTEKIIAKQFNRFVAREFKKARL